MTLRELLSHTAGTNIQGFPDYAAGAPVPTTLQVLDGAPPATNPPVRVNTDGPTGAPHRAHHPLRPICTKAICRHLYDEPVVSFFVSLQNDKLFIQGSGQPQLELWRESKTRFTFVVDVDVEFVHGARGRLTGMNVLQDGKTMFASKQ